MKYIKKSEMTKSQIIEKYNLKKQNKDCFGSHLSYDCYKREEENNNIKTIYTLENEMSVDLDDGSIYFFTTQKFDYNKPVYIKRLGITRPTITTKCVEIRG